MRRFPLLRGLKQDPDGFASAPGPDLGSLRRRDDIIEGAFVWPHDPAFRPLIAIYADGGLRQLGTTYRRPFHQHRTWPCCFSIELDEDLAERQDLTVAVFETGAILGAQAVKKDIATVEELIEAGGRNARPFAYGGFVSFLFLPLNDQIKILFRDVLDRDAAALEVETYRQRVIDGEFTILALRDEIALSEEAKETCAPLTLHERRGRACLWDGLNQALDRVIPAPLARDGCRSNIPLSLRSAFEEITNPSDARSILAANAVGTTFDIGAYAQWVAAHQNIVAGVEDTVFRSTEVRAQISGHRYRLGGLLAAMKTGKTASRRANGIVTAKAGSAGVVVYGPYIPLEPGHYTILFSMQTTAPEDGPLQLGLEVVHGDILFARRNIVLHEATKDIWRMAFTVPSGRQELLRSPKFEFRVATNGAAAVTCDFIALDVSEDAHVGMMTHPSVENWLPSLTPEIAGERVDDGTLRALSPSGRVFFGPYCKLLPGRYALSLSYELDPDSPPKEVEYEVAAAAHNNLARRRFVLTPGCGREEIQFEIAEAETAEELAGPLEFRLWKEAGFEFHCLAVGLTVLGDGEVLD